MHLAAQTIALIAIIGGVVVNPVTSLLKRESWPTQLKQVISIVVACAVTSAAIAITQPSLFSSATSVVSLLSLVWGASQVTYLALFQGSVVETALASVGSSKPAAAPPL